MINKHAYNCHKYRTHHLPPGGSFCCWPGAETYVADLTGLIFTRLGCFRRSFFCEYLEPQWLTGVKRREWIGMGVAGMIIMSDEMDHSLIPY